MLDGETRDAMETSIDRSRAARAHSQCRAGCRGPRPSSIVFAGGAQTSTTRMLSCTRVASGVHTSEDIQAHLSQATVLAAGSVVHELSLFSLHILQTSGIHEQSITLRHMEKSSVHPKSLLIDTSADLYAGPSRSSPGEGCWTYDEQDPSDLSPTWIRFS